MGRARADGKIEKYGLLWEKGTASLGIELTCYRTNHPVAEGGLGCEGHFKNAWAIMWPKYEWNDWTAMMVSAWCNYKYIMVIGAQRASKTYTFAHCAYLDYMSNPIETMTSIATVTFDGLRQRMWSDILQAHETCVLVQNNINGLTVRSTTNECRIYLTESAREAAEKFQIHGMSVSRTEDAEGRIRGGHANRRRIILDEAQDMPMAIFDAVSNPMSAPDAKFVALSNPVEKVSRFGEWCEPEQGWSSVDENDEFWKLRVGGGQGICLHFDGLKSPNIKAGRTLYPYMITQQSIDEVISIHGPDSVQYWALIRGFFPPDGMVS